MLPVRSDHNTNELQENAQPTPTFQEVKVITAQGSAQYRGLGVVELVTKGGTNHFHGQFYELNQNNHLQAKVFNQRNAVPFLQHNEYGFQIGGPVWIPKLYDGKNKTFFFFDAERIQQNANKVEQYFVPTMSERQGNLSDVLANTTGVPVTIYDPNSKSLGAPYSRTAFAGNTVPANRLNPVTQKIMGINAGSWVGPSPGAGPGRIRRAQRLAYFYAGRECQLHPRGACGHSVRQPRPQRTRADCRRYSAAGPAHISDQPILAAVLLQQLWVLAGWILEGIDRDNPKDYPDQTISASDQFS
jgi:hypothetical protein